MVTLLGSNCSITIVFEVLEIIRVVSVVWGDDIIFEQAIQKVGIFVLCIPCFGRLQLYMFCAIQNRFNFDGKLFGIDGGQICRTCRLEVHSRLSSDFYRKIASVLETCETFFQNSATCKFRTWRTGKW